MKKLGWVVLAGFGVLSCSKAEVKPSELIAWVEDENNGLRKTASFEHFTFEATYKPTDYVVAMEAKTDELSESKYQTIHSEVRGMQYVDLKIKTSSGNGNALNGQLEDESEYYERLDYFVTYASQDIYLIQGRDTLFPSLYHFERNYGLAPYNTLLLGFEGDNNSDVKILTVDDKVLGVGRVKFEFRKEDIKATPKLKRS